MTSLKCDISNIYQLIEKLRVNVSDFYSLHTNQIYSLQNNNILNTNQINEIKETVSLLEDNTTDDEYTLTELENIFAKKFNLTVSGLSQISGDVNINDNKRIYVNSNLLETFNKTKRTIYSIKNSNGSHSFINIPINTANQSSSNLSQIYLCSLTRADGVYSIENTNPVFSFYLLCSNYSVMPPIPIIQNQIHSYYYDEVNSQMYVEFDRVYKTELSTLFSQNQIQ